jgi:serine/threonine protein kinase
MCAPAIIIAALCHLGPEAAQLADTRERLPLHWVCRRSPDDRDTERVFQILIKTAPETLLHRDDAGRTPLHWLFWHHAPSRSPSLVRLLCHQLPVQSFRDIRQPRDSHNERYPLPDIPIPNGDDIPAVSAVVPDARHGAIPLHYAVMQGTNRDALKALISEYPTSVTYGDRKGRTALAWYLGAGHLLDDNKRHISGEPNDPSVTPWWEVELSPSMIQMLVSSKVARTVDDMGRTPLHWACHFYARSMVATGVSTLPVVGVQSLVDIHIEAVLSCDTEGKTPLHLLFSIVAEQQHQEHQRLLSNGTLRDHVDLETGGPAAFKPDTGLIELLLKVPESDGYDAFRFDNGRDDKKPFAASYVEDKYGLLPLHIALKVATEPDIIKLLIQSNPTSLIHASEDDLKTPLIHAFSSEYTAPLQPVQNFDLLMSAYVTSRHGTFIDGRVSLKMEDTTGMYPLHYACRKEACSEIIRAFVEKFPHCAVYENADGDTPLHCLLSDDALFKANTAGAKSGATLVRDSVGLQTEKEVAWQNKVQKAYREKMRILLEPLRTKRHLMVASSSHGMTPLHIAVAFKVVPYLSLYRMLDIYPEGAATLTSQEGFHFSCMDLHERNREDTDDIAEWDGIRELLFAFNPMVGNYRKQDELLEACVQMIRNEIMGKGSYHSLQLQSSLPDFSTLELKDTLSTLDVPDIDVVHRPLSTRKKSELIKQTKKVPNKKNSAGMAGAFSVKEKKKAAKSIYDDDLDDRYVVSPANSAADDDDDDDFLLSHEEEEEYDSAEGSDSQAGDRGSFQHGSSRSWDREVSRDQSRTTTESAGTPTNVRSPTRTFTASARRGIRSWRDPRKTDSNHIEEKKEEKPGFSPDDIVLSEVAMRLWCFFLLYYDPKNPADNHLKQVEAITEGLDSGTLHHLVSWAVPEYAEVYLKAGTSLQGVTLADVLSPASNALFHSFQYFLGRYEFYTEVDRVLLHRTSDGNTILIMASEHVMRTKEFLPKQEFAPGEAEESIWETGEKVEEDGGYEASKFVDKKRSVCFKLTKNQEAYDNEVECRAHLGMLSGSPAVGNILPIIGNYSSLSDSTYGRRYAMEIHDERFRTLNLVGGESIRLADYPYALVYPYCEEGDLFDYFVHHGLNGMEEVTEIGRQVALALKTLHEKGVVHGNLSMRNVTVVPVGDDASKRSWVVSDFSTATKSQNGTAFMGAISHNGSAQFKTGLLPPEMFVKLTAAEARIYQTYWEMVERVYRVNVDNKVVEPFVNLQTGATYVLRCHFTLTENQSVDVALPELPYQLVAARESTDIWCFGLLLFTLCSGGHPLFPSNLKTGHLLNYESIVGWSHEQAAAQIYEHVEDPIAQDLLLKMLAPFEDRAELSMETVLNHPLFNNSAGATKLIGKLIDKRLHESAAYDRKRQKVVSEKSDDNWLESRTTSVTCWNFDLLRKFNFGSTEVLSKIFGQRTAALSMPCNFILLPYKLSAKNKKAKLAPTTKKDVERAERMGVLLLSLGKTCTFACQISAVVEGTERKQWTASALLDELVLSDEDFGTVKETFLKTAASQVEEFRSNPVSAALKLIERQIAEIRKFFKEAGTAFLYLVDEYAGIPLVGSSYSPYPLEVSESIIDKFLVRALPFMNISVLYARGVAGGVSGLVRLIFEAAYPHVPPSWASAASGLEHKLDESLFLNEISILRRALALVYSSKTSFLEDDLRFVRDSCLKIDTRGTFGDMHRVVSSGYTLWTTKQGAAEIQEACTGFGIKEALDVQVGLEESLKAQEDQIKLLQKEIEQLSFRKDLNLDVPENSSSTRQTVNKSTVPKEITTPTAASISVKQDLGTPRASSKLPVIASSNGTGGKSELWRDNAHEDHEEQELDMDEVEPSSESAAPTPSSTEDRFYDVKEGPSRDGQVLDVPSFDEALRKSLSTNEERDAIGEDTATYKSDAESLREVMSLD